MGFFRVDAATTSPNVNNTFSLLNNFFEEKIFLDTSLFNTQPVAVSTDTLYSGIDWLYTYVEIIYAYDYKILYFWLLNSVYDESVDFLYISL